MIKYNKQLILNKLNDYGWRNDISLFVFENCEKVEEIDVTLFDDCFEISYEMNSYSITYKQYIISAGYWNNRLEEFFNINLNEYGELCTFLDNLVDSIKSLYNNENTIPKRYLTKSGNNFIDVLKNEMLADEEFKGFVKGCMLKYIFRYENKGGLEDLKKADNYLKMLEDIERGKHND